MFAKFADIPAVLLRTDFRVGGDQLAGGDPWNLMSSFYPRTKVVRLNAMSLYHQNLGAGEYASAAAGIGLIALTADAVIAAFDELLLVPATLPEDLQAPVKRWLELMPGFAEPPAVN